MLKTAKLYTIPIYFYNPNILLVYSFILLTILSLSSLSLTSIAFITISTEFFDDDILFTFSINFLFSSFITKSFLVSYKERTEETNDELLISSTKCFRTYERVLFGSGSSVSSQRENELQKEFSF